MTKRRMKRDERAEEILNAALKVSEEHGYDKVSRAQIAEEANCAESLISFYFSTMDDVRDTIMKEAILKHNLKIIAQGIISNSEHVLTASKYLKQEALLSIL